MEPLESEKRARWGEVGAGNEREERESRDVTKPATHLLCPWALVLSSAVSPPILQEAIR